MKMHKCQNKLKEEKLSTITDLTRLRLSIEVRLDETALRLKDDCANDNWIEKHTPKWHLKCRN